MFKLKNYQEKYINEIEHKINEFINLDSNKICIFKSPTGSGKTIMIAELIERLANNRADKKEIAFIWISVHKLHDQSKNKLEEYYEDLKIISCSFFEDLQDKMIQDKEILFFNWHSINQKKNIFIRDNENNFNLSKVLENTKNAGRDIILIIDESHHTADSEKSKNLINMIDPKITVEVSATPKISSVNAYNINIDLQEVKDEEMIKKSIHLNSNLLNDNSLSTDEMMLKTALEKRKQLLDYYKYENSNVNPLVLIQLPDSHKGISDKKDEVMKILNSKFNINIDNGKLAIYLSEKDNKVNLINIEKNDNEVEVLIFKQAITVGWDCPRSSILVLFREWQSFEFSIQTIGRIIRMPEIKHYDTDDLNRAYIYTNIEKVQIAEDVSKDYITIYESIRDESLYNSLELQSIYFQRKNEKTALDKNFRKIFLDIAIKKQLAKKISTKVPKFKSVIIKDAKTERLDKDQILKGDFLIRDSQTADLHNAFIHFTREMTEPFAQIRSYPVIKRALYRFFESETNIEDLNDMANIIMYEKNKNQFIKIINSSKEQFIKDVVEKVEREFEYLPNWNVPKIIEHTKIHKKQNYTKCIMKPPYIRVDSDIELKFIAHLEKEIGVKWWFKNGVSDKKYFAISYKNMMDGELHPFYVDFVIYMNDDRIGLFDTKAGYTAENDKAKAKAESLSKYIEDSNNKKIFGGIVTSVNGEWLYNDCKEYNYSGKDFSDWKILELT